MTILKMPSCNKDKIKYYKYYVMLYIFCFMLFVIVGSLYESNHIEKKDYEKDSVWWHGIILLVVGFVWTILVHVIAKYFNVSSFIHNNAVFWSATHLILYTLLGYLAPGQWPFWIAAGIAWEFMECYSICWSAINMPVGCNGYHDIITNIAGIAIGIWIKIGTS